MSNEAVVATCLALAGCGVLLARFISKRLRVVVTRVGGPAPLATSLVPPFSWIGPRSEKTLRSVMAIVTAGFEMASNRPIRLRDQAYREASFQVPHEVARLSPGAPGGGRVQEMAPLSIAREWQEETTKGAGQGGGEGLKPPFNIEREARVFLHFPKGSDRATVAFLAINADFGPSPMREEARVVRKRSNKQQTRLMNAAKAVWKCQYAQWVRLRPDIVRRIEPDELPLIITFRGTVWGMLWDTRGKTFVDLGPGMMMTDFYNKDS